MSKHLIRDLDVLKTELLEMGRRVEESISQATRALRTKDRELAKSVIAADAAIDMLENGIEDACLKILALHQPVAQDLRFVVVALKVNNDLERVGDLAANFAERALDLRELPPLQLDLDIDGMGEAARGMLRRSLDALVTLDVDLARQVCKDDDAVDQMHRGMFKVVQAHMNAHPEHVEQGVELLSLSRYLERIADLATNIAEDLIFLVEGDIVRHRQI